jgi:hypothetical protein
MSRRRRRDWRRLLFGDWNGAIRDPLDLIRLTFLAGAILTLITGYPAATLRLVLTFAGTVAVRQLQLPRPFDLAFLIGMSLQAWGNTFHLFTSFSDYDLIVHFVLPLAVAPAVYIMLSRSEVVPDLAGGRTQPHHYLGVWLITFALGFSIGALYEIYEYVANHLLGGDLKVGYSDTISDLADDALASALGGLLLVVWAQRGWATTRRVPAEMLPFGEEAPGDHA